VPDGFVWSRVFAIIDLTCMDTLLLLGRLLICGVFLVAGLSKLADRAGSRQSMIAFGVPHALAGLLGICLPIAEIAIAVALIPASQAWLAAWGALALLVLFILGIGITLARGRKPDCHCFGQLHSKPIGLDLMGRNVVLALIPALIVYHGPRQPNFPSWFTFNSGGTVLLVLALAGLGLVLVQTWLVFQLVQQGGRVLHRLDAIEKNAGIGGQAAAAGPAPLGIPVGEPAPEFELEDLEGRPRSLEQLRSGGKPVLLLFTNPGCGPCHALLPEAVVWQRDSAEFFNLVFMSEGTVHDNRAKADEHGLNTVLLQRKRELAEAYKAEATPSAVLVRSDGKIGSAVAAGTEAIRTLVSNTINESLAGLVSIQLQEGNSAPPLVYPDLDGKMINLSQLRGEPATLLFWNPGCGYCQQMIEDVKAWEKKLAKTSRQALIISTGTVEANRNLGFRSRIVLDQNFSAGKAFGAGGTPSALMLDNQGKVVSKVAVGRPDILESIFSDRATADAPMPAARK
jgi:methylamine dehydrogenase accessory protein MauD